MIDNVVIILYPDIKHPLANEKMPVRIKYINLVAYFVKKYVSNEDMANIKIKSLADVLVDDGEFKSEDIKDSIKDSMGVLKTRFSPFRFFSYRYLFLYDVLLLVAEQGNTIALKIEKEFCSWINKRYHGKIKNMVSLMNQNNEIFAKETLITKDMVNSWIDIKKYLETDISRIFFTATMSAGKSTLINAMIGRDVSDVKKAACTANVLHFYNIPSNNDCFMLLDNNEIREKSSRELKEIIRSDEKPHYICGFFNSEFSNKRVELIDTPGINSARNPKHKKITHKALDECNGDTLVYVIPVENYGGEDDYSHLQYVLKHVNYGRIIFLVNLIDTCDFEDDSLDEILDDIRKHLIDIGYENPCVFPISAKAGLDIKKKICGLSASNNEIDSANSFIKKFLCDDYNLLKYYDKNAKLSDTENIEHEALEKTGIRALERLL